jgi:hypothetical protein
MSYISESYQTKVKEALWPPLTDDNKATTYHPGYIIFQDGNTVAGRHVNR